MIPLFNGIGIGIGTTNFWNNYENLIPEPNPARNHDITNAHTLQANAWSSSSSSPPHGAAPLSPPSSKPGMEWNGSSLHSAKCSSSIFDNVVEAGQDISSLLGRFVVRCYNIPRDKLVVVVGAHSYVLEKWTQIDVREGILWQRQYTHCFPLQLRLPVAFTGD